MKKPKRKNKLLALWCPFCLSAEGGVSEIGTFWGGPMQYFVMCGKCSAGGPFALTRKDAVTKWNTRGVLGR